MCGVIGYIGNGTDLTPEGRGTILSLFLKMQSRGDEATGIVTYKIGKQPKLLRAPVPASTFVQSSMFLSLLNEDFDFLIGHTRKSTGGNPINNSNNHPHFRKPNFVVHNGYVTPNPEPELDPRVSMCDSEYIVALIDEVGIEEAFDSLDKWTGSYVILNLNTDENALYIIKHNNPLVCYENNNVIPGIYISSVFADTREAVEENTTEDNAFQDTDHISENTLIKITKEEIINVKEKPKNNTYYGKNSNYNLKRSYTPGMYWNRDQKSDTNLWNHFD